MAGLLTPLSLEPGASMLEAAPCRSLCLRPWGSSLLHSPMISEDKTGISRPALILLWSLEKAERREPTPLSLDKSGPQGGEGKWLTLQMILREDLQSLQIPHPSPSLQAHSSPTPPRVTVRHGAMHLTVG